MKPSLSTNMLPYVDGCMSMQVPALPTLIYMSLVRSSSMLSDGSKIEQPLMVRWKLYRVRIEQLHKTKEESHIKSICDHSRGAEPRPRRRASSRAPRWPRRGPPALCQLQAGVASTAGSKAGRHSEARVYRLLGTTCLHTAQQSGGLLQTDPFGLMQSLFANLRLEFGIFFSAVL